MISWFEKHKKMSWMITVIIAIMIFYVSSLTFAPSGTGTGSSIKATLYHILAFFFFALFLFISSVNGKLDSRVIFLTFLIAIVYSMSDEVHQLFVPGRGATIRDVFLDSLGIFYAFMIYSISLQYREIKNGKNSN